MTTREKLKSMLVQKGMFDDEAEAVLAIAIPKIEAATPNYRITWDRPEHEYPEPVLRAMWLHVKQAAKEWITKNAPEAWYRPLFD